MCTHVRTHTHTHTHKKWKPDNFPGEFIAGADHVTSSDLQCDFRRDGKIWSQLKTSLILWLILEIPPLLLISLVWLCHDSNVRQKEENEELRDKKNKPKSTEKSLCQDEFCLELAFLLVRLMVHLVMLLIWAITPTSSLLSFLPF